MHLLRIHMTVPVHEVNDQGSSLTQDEQRRTTSSPTRGYAEGSFSPRRSLVHDCSSNADKVAPPSHSVQNEGVTSQQDGQRRKHTKDQRRSTRPRDGEPEEVRAMVPGYIEAEEDPIQMEIQGDKRQCQSAEIIALEKQSRVDGSNNHTDTYKE